MGSICDKHGWKLSWMDRDQKWLTAAASPMYREMYADEHLLEHIQIASQPTLEENDQDTEEVRSSVPPEDIGVKVVHPQRGSFILELQNITPLRLLMQTFSLRVGWPARKLRFFLRGF